MDENSNDSCSSRNIDYSNKKFYFEGKGIIVSFDEDDVLLVFRRDNLALHVYFPIERINEISAKIGSRVEHSVVEDGVNYESRLRLIK